ncbi:hypothetical protein MNBD_GAMMA15-832 [hydrothermal vent metagenome]|uniref:Lipoprotein n=1 Tax=hydrothermal vent metagenome TaxID=652676 RepID=A0A3B0Y219_9ZZZZ
METLKHLSLIAIILLSSACTSISSVHPLGTDTVQLVEHEWRGTWIAQDGTLQLDVLDTKAGIIELVFIEHGKIEKYTVTIKKSGQDTYMNLLNKDKSYLFAKFKKRYNQIIVWPPSSKAMKVAIASEAIKGEITKDDDLLITADKDNLNKFFADNSEKMLFEYDEPVVFRKNVK